MWTESHCSYVAACADVLLAEACECALVGGVLGDRGPAREPVLGFVLDNTTLIVGIHLQTAG